MAIKRVHVQMETKFCLLTFKTSPVRWCTWIFYTLQYYKCSYCST